MLICTCVAAKTYQNITEILLFLDYLAMMFYQACGEKLCFIRCVMFNAGGACAFIR